MIFLSKGWSHVLIEKWFIYVVAEKKKRRFCIHQQRKHAYIILNQLSNLGGEANRLPKKYACHNWIIFLKGSKIWHVFFMPPQLWVPAAQTFGCPSHARRYRGGPSPFLYLSAVLHKSNEGHRGCAILFHSTWRSWSREINLRTLEKIIKNYICKITQLAFTA